MERKSEGKERNRKKKGNERKEKWSIFLLIFES
jgi:hypothetical protein